MRVAGCAGALVVASLLAVPSAQAQGHRGAPPGPITKTNKTPGGSGSTPSTPSSPLPDTPAAPTSVVQARSFGMWIDDATLAPGGSVWVTAAVTRWSTPSSHGVDAPSIGVAAGLAPRAQLSLSVPYSRMSTPDGSLPGGLGDVYAGAKFLLREPGAGRVGLSVAPTLEILNPPGGRRSAGLVLPLSAEAGSANVRVYGSTGFFSRGAVFGSGAVEVHVSPTVSATVSLLRSWSTADAATNDAQGLARSRTDISATVVEIVRPSVAVFGNVGRTISRMEFDSARFVLAGGIAFVLTPPNEIPIRPPR
jgi:hypothetical protein